MIVKCFGCTKIHNKALYKCLIHSFIQCIIVLCVPRLMSSVHEMDCLREETVSVSGRSGVQSSVASTRR